MPDEPKPRRVSGILTRTVTERAVFILDRDGRIESVEDVLEEIESSEECVRSLHSIQTVHP